MTQVEKLVALLIIFPPDPRPINPSAALTIAIN